eukprot:c25790_g1_i1 orf=269-3280(+)
MAGPKTGSGGGFAIPANDRKLVQSLKEIVANSEEEIYAMLKECNMDPNETAQRLLSEDMFHVVKRKRDKRKENVNVKEISDSKSRVANLISPSKGGKSGGMSDRGVGRGVTSAYLDSNDISGSHGKALPSGDNGAYSSVKGWNTASSSASHNQTNDHLKGSSTSVSGCASSLPNGSTLQSKCATGSQGTWVAGSGHATMADIVRSNGPHVMRPAVGTSISVSVSNEVQYSPMSQPYATAVSSIPSVYSSASDSMLNPSFDPCASALVSSMKRDVGTVGNQRPIGDRVSSPPSEVNVTPSSQTHHLHIPQASSGPVSSGLVISMKSDVGTAGTQRPIIDGVSIASSEANLIPSSQPQHLRLPRASSESPVPSNDLDPDLKVIQSRGPTLAVENLDDQAENAENSRAVVGIQDHSGVVHSPSLPGLSSSGTVVGGHLNSVLAYRTQKSSLGIQKATGGGMDWSSKPTIQNGSTISATAAAQGTSTTAADLVSHPLPSPPADTRILSGTTMKLQMLDLQDSQPVIIPEHLRVSESDCTRLSFGSFGAEFGTTFPTGFVSSENEKASINEENALPGVASVAEQPCASSDLGTSMTSLNQHQQTLPATVESLVSSSDESVSSPVTTMLHLEPIKSETVQQCAQFSYLPAAPDYHGFNLTSQMNNSSEQTESRSHDLSRLPSVLQPYLDPTSNYYNATFRSPTEGDARYSSLLVSSTGGKVQTNMPTGQITSSALEGGNASHLSASGSLGMIAQCGNNQTALTASQQSLPIHAYTAQPSGLPLGPFTNVFSYQYVPPSFAYLPSPYQHSYAGNSGYHQAPTGSSYPVSGGGAAVKYPMPQYKPGGGGGAGLHSAVVAGTAGYGGYSNSPTGTYAVNPTVTIGNSTGYDDAAPQYKDNSLYIQNQQVEGSAMWLQAQLSREMPAVQPASYYALPGQNQHSVYSHPQPSHAHTHPAAAYAGIYHPQQSGPGASAHQLFQQSQVLGTVGASGVHTGSYQQPQRAQQTWANNF